MRFYFKKNIIMICFIFGYDCAHAETLNILQIKEWRYCVEDLIWEAKFSSFNQRVIQQIQVLHTNNRSCLEYKYLRCCIPGIIKWSGALKMGLQFNDGLPIYNGALELNHNSYKIVCRLSRYGNFNCE